MASPVDIVGYTYMAANFTPDALIEEMVSRGELSPAARDMGAEEVLDQHAAANGIDRQDEHTFDSDDFPKVIFEDHLTTDDHEWMGWDALPGEYADGRTFIDLKSGPFAGERIESE